MPRQRAAMTWVGDRWVPTEEAYAGQQGQPYSKWEQGLPQGVADFYRQQGVDRGSRGNRYDREWWDIGLRSPIQYGWQPDSGFQGNQQGLQDFSGQYGDLSNLGFSMRLPGAHIAPEVQFMANRRVAERNQRLLWDATQRGRQAYGQIGGLLEKGREAIRGGVRGAQGAYSQGLENLQSYRPGGAAAMMSPFYGGMAQTSMQGAAGVAGLYGQQASYLPGRAQFEMGQAMARQVEAPDLMFRYDEKVRKSAEREARQARNIGYIMGGAQLLAGLAGAAFGGGGIGAAGLSQMGQGGGGGSPYWRGNNQQFNYGFGWR